MKLDPIRVRLTAWYVGILAAVLIAMSVGIYVLLGRSLSQRIDDNLRSVLEIAATSLANDIAEGQSRQDAAESTAAELFAGQQMLAIFDERGMVLAERGRDEDLDFNLPPVDTIPLAGAALYTVEERDQDRDFHRLAVRVVDIAQGNVRYVVLAGSSLESLQDELDSVRGVLFSVVPIALTIVAIGGWLLARQSLARVVDMAQRQRRFMADASHELRTPIATAQTAAGVALQQPTRDEASYRAALQLIEQQTSRLGRLVDDMFTLARADEGSHPIHAGPLYLDELIDEVIRSARVMAMSKRLAIESAMESGAAFDGDEDLLRRLILNLVDNAIRYAPEGTSIRITLAREPRHYRIEVADRGPGIPLEAQHHIFERFFRFNAARTRGVRAHDGGAGLGLAIARWIAEQHGGELTLLHSSSEGTTFRIDLPVADSSAAPR